MTQAPDDSKPRPPTPGAEGVTLAHFFELSLDLLTVAGFDGYFKQLSPMWSRTLGWTMEEFLSTPSVEFASNREVGRGIGLGLSICHNLVTELGGRITVASQEGRGTTVRVELPAAG